MCSTSRGGKICGNDPCNDLISALANEDSIKVQSTEDGEFTVLGSDMETGCELTISPLVSFLYNADPAYLPLAHALPRFVFSIVLIMFQ